MRIGVGLPSTLPSASGPLLLDWARRADASLFSSLAVLDRVVYDSFDPLLALAAVVGVTERIRLATNIVIGPLRATTLLAKEAASLHALSNGRLTLGLAVGARKEDYDALGVPYASRGRRFEEQLAELQSTWEKGGSAPPAPDTRGPTILLGGSSDQVFGRVARYADGYIHGGGPPRAFARMADKARAAWADVGRPGRPELWGQAYFALGDDAAIEAGRRYMREYYAFTGPFAERIASGLLTAPQSIVQTLRGYEDAGCDELVLFPTVADLMQIERLIEIVARLGGQPAPTFAQARTM